MCPTCVIINYDIHLGCEFKKGSRSQISLCLVSWNIFTVGVFFFFSSSSGVFFFSSILASFLLIKLFFCCLIYWILLLLSLHSIFIIFILFSSQAPSCLPQKPYFAQGHKKKFIFIVCAFQFISCLLKLKLLGFA